MKLPSIDTNALMINVALFFLGIHLFSGNSKLIFHLNNDRVNPAIEIFTFSQWHQEDILTSMIFSLTYSIITALLIKLLINNMNRDLKAKITYIQWFAVLDSIVIFMNYFRIDLDHVHIYSRDEYTLTLFYIIGALFYAFYTYSIIYIFAKIRLNNHSEMDMRQKIVILQEAGLNNGEIAKRLNISDSKFYKIMKNH